MYIILEMTPEIQIKLINLRSQFPCGHLSLQSLRALVTTEDHHDYLKEID